MDKIEKSVSRPEPKRPSPMMREPNLREAMEVFTPRWLKRLSRSAKRSA
jgi:hypothetical protein